jgi:hypothetical protein
MIVECKFCDSTYKAFTPKEMNTCMYCGKDFSKNNIKSQDAIRKDVPLKPSFKDVLLSLIYFYLSIDYLGGTFGRLFFVLTQEIFSDAPILIFFLGIIIRTTFFIVLLKIFLLRRLRRTQPIRNLNHKLKIPYYFYMGLTLLHFTFFGFISFTVNKELPLLSFEISHLIFPAAFLFWFVVDRFIVSNYLRLVDNFSAPKILNTFKNVKSLPEIQDHSDIPPPIPGSLQYN